MRPGWLPASPLGDGGLSCDATPPIAAYQAGRPHVSPVRGNILKAIRASILAMYHRPAGRYCAERGPQRMLVLVIDQDQINAFFSFERIRHSSPHLHFSFRHSSPTGSEPVEALDLDPELGLNVNDPIRLLTYGGPLHR